MLRSMLARIGARLGIDTDAESDEKVDGDDEKGADAHDPDLFRLIISS